MCQPCNKPLCEYSSLMGDHKYSTEEFHSRIFMLQKMINNPDIFREYYESAANIPCPFCTMLCWHVPKVNLHTELMAINDRVIVECPVCDRDYDVDIDEGRCDNDDHEDCCEE